MRLKISFLTFLLTSPLIQSDTLREAVQHGLITHPDVLLNRAKTLSAKQGIGVARGAFYPTIDLAGGAGREYSLNPTTAGIEGGSGHIVPHKYVYKLLYQANYLIIVSKLMKS